MKPDFTTQSIYQMNIVKDDKIIYEGFFNEKAWNKTIENDVLWEYIPDNRRVIEKNLSKEGKLDMGNATIENNIIKINLCSAKKEEQNDNIDIKDVLFMLQEVVRQRKIEMPANSYTTHLFEKGEEKILKKMGEECIEVILAKDKNEDVIYESADLLYHLMVFLVYKKIPIEDILTELKSRFK